MKKLLAVLGIVILLCGNVWAAGEISSLTAQTDPPAAGDLMEIVDVSDTITMAATGTNKKITAAQLFNTTVPILTTGIVDGLTNVNVSTGTTITVGGTGKLSSVNLNQHATPAQAVAANLPVASVGQAHIIKNSQGAGGANTGILTVHPVTGTTMNYNGANCSASQNLVSGGAAGDSLTVVGITTTLWEVVGSKGTWTCTTP